ncbi:MAG: TonB-dependent receptor [Bacteroidales bacterium]|nr:TonB-dependent receptor [Bacteroidales bacterium]
MNYRLLCAIPAAWLVSLCNVYAQKGDTLIMHNPIPIVNYRYRNNASVQRMSQEDIKPLAVTKIADALKLMNSVNIKDYGGIGGLQTVSVRGLGASHTLINYDGIQISNTQAGQVDISRFNFNEGQVLQLEIGSAGYLATAREYASPATINIQSSKPNFRDGHSDAVSASLMTGSFGLVGTCAQWAHKLSNYGYIKADGEITTANGEYPFTLTNYKTVTRERRINSDVLTYHGEVSYSMDNYLNELNLKAYAYKSDRGLPGSVVLYNKTANERLMDKNCFFQGSFRHRFGDILTAKMYAKANYSNSLYTDRNVKYQDGLLTENSTQKELYLSEVANVKIQKIRSFATLSIDETHSTLESNIKNCPMPSRNTLQGALEYGGKLLDIFNYRLIGIYTRVREKVETGKHFQDLDKWTPTVKIYRDFNNSFIPSVAVTYKNTFRVPTFNELYYTSLGTTGLVPEKAQEFQLDLDWDRHFALAIYRNYVKDKIVAIPTTYVWKMRNYGQVDITGVDLSASHKFTLGAAGLIVNCKYTYQEALNTHDKNPKLDGGQIPYTPLHSGSNSLILNTKFVNIGYSSVWSGKRYFDKYNIPDNEMDPYIEHTVSLSHEFNVGEWRMSAKVSCINIADLQYDVIKYYPMPGRNWRIQLNFTL